MNVLKIVNILLIIILLIYGIDTIIKFKKNENKKIEDIRNSFVKRINIIMILTIILGIITILNIIFK